MSTHYDLYCIPCDDRCGMSINHGADAINDLIPALPVVRAFYDAAPDSAYCWEIDAQPYDLHLLNVAHWYDLHKAHHVVIRDEYGHMQELTPPPPRQPASPVRYCPGCGWPGGQHAPSCPDTEATSDGS